MGASGGFLWTLEWTIGFYKRREIKWRVEERSVSFFVQFVLSKAPASQQLARAVTSEWRGSKRPFQFEHKYTASERDSWWNAVAMECGWQCPRGLGTWLFVGGPWKGERLRRFCSIHRGNWYIHQYLHFLVCFKIRIFICAQDTCFVFTDFNYDITFRHRCWQAIVHFMCLRGKCCHF
jgi:hypothetical protein